MRLSLIKGWQGHHPCRYLDALISVGVRWLNTFEALSHSPSVNGFDCKTSSQL